MAYGVEYRGEWLMSDDVTEVRCSIYDTTVFVADPEDADVIPMKMGGNPLTIELIDNDKDKFTPIKARQANIEILTENGIDIVTFTSGNDLRWFVEITIDETVLFRGFLVIAEISQAFMPHKNVLNLTASDMLGSLKDIPLVDADEEVPTGHNKLIKYIAWSLLKTGLNRNIYVVNNVRHGRGSKTALATFQASGNQAILAITDFFYVGQEVTISGTASNNVTRIVTDVAQSIVTIVAFDGAIVNESEVMATFTDTSSEDHLYETIYLDAKTFEDEVGNCENCYSVLEKILKEDCILTQYKGDWWIIRTDEFDENLIIVWEWNDQGDYVADFEPTTYDKTIGEGEDLYFINGTQSLQRDRPLNIAKLIYNYKFPLEIPCNINFDRGDLILDSGTTKTYEVDCWTLRRGFEGSYQATTITPVIRRVFDEFDREIERYVVVPNAASSSHKEYLESSAIIVQEKDKITVSCDWRMETSVGFSGGIFAHYMQVVLKGEDGSGIF